MNLFHRALWTYRDLMGPDGLPIGPTFGFMSMIIGLMERYNTGDIVVAWEGKNNWRKTKSDYKANRAKREFSEDEKLMYNYNMSAVLEILAMLPIAQIKNDHLEADDTIFYGVWHAKGGVNDITIVSNDKDYMQLIDDTRHVKMARPDKGGYIDTDESICFEKFGVRPKYMGVYLALVGDVGDNVKGITGVGPVRAKKIIEYINNCGSISQGIRESLILSSLIKEFLQSYRMVAMSKKLITKVNKYKNSFVLTFGKRKVLKLQNKLDSYNIRKFSAIDFARRLETRQEGDWFKSLLSAIYL